MAGPTSIALKIRLDLDDIARQLGPAAGPVRRVDLREADHRAGAGASGDLPVRRASLDAPAFARTVERTEFYDSTQTWRKHLTEEQGALVLEFMERTEGAGGREPQRSAP